MQLKRPFIALNKQKSGSKTRLREGNYITLLNKEAQGRAGESGDRNVPLLLCGPRWIY